MNDRTEIRAMRRSHQKSRNGCIKCKQKKIKCDEGRPSCGYCTARSSECIYRRSQPTIPTDPKVAASNPNSPEVLTPAVSQQIAPCPGFVSPGARSIVSGHNANPAFEIPISSLSSTNPPPSPSLIQRQWSTQDLELLHFYSTSTCFTLSDDQERTRVYQHIAPKIALSHDFLLHGLLAIAALHLSKVAPERKESLRAYASEHQNIAVSLFRLAFANISLDNCLACCVYSSFLAVYMWAASDGKGNLFFARTADQPQEDQVEWVQLLRGSGKINRLYRDEISRSALAPIIGWDRGAEQAAEANPVEAARFAALEKLWDTSDQSFSPAELNALQETLTTLRTSYTMITTLKPDSRLNCTSVALAWAVGVPEIYLEMVSRRQPAALILLAHFCLVLNKVEDFWWIRGLSRRLLQDIHQTLGNEWDSWIGWPLQDLILYEFKMDNP